MKIPLSGIRCLIVILLLLCTNIYSSFSQTSVSGIVVDAADKAKLEKASIALLQQKDSILVKFTWSKDNGEFLIHNLDTGKFTLIVSYPKYADYSYAFLSKGEPINLQTISLSKAALLLDEITVTGRSPVVINGDTTIYDAGSFKVAKDANVEDLLKVLPGITVDATGKITAQGKTVQKVLLDGEEFFGNDPKLITKNIRSNMVDKVKVYEKKSDQATITGIDDGERSQTIDITLKQDMKKGMFGQALASGGTDKYYGAKLMANKFKGSEKIAVYGISANDGMVSLGVEDGQKYGVGNGSVEVDNNNIYYNSSGDDGTSGGWYGQYQGNGVPRAINVGGSYSNKFNKDKHKINLNYQRAQLSVDNNSTLFSQNNLPDEARIETANGFTSSKKVTNTANLRYDLKADSLTDIIFKLAYSKSHQDDFSRDSTQELTIDYDLINQVRSSRSGTNEADRINANLMITRRFLKERRSLTLTSALIANKNDADFNYYSRTAFVNGAPDILIDQKKNNVSHNSSFNAALTYSEPFSKRITGTIGYSIGRYNSSVLDQSFDKNKNTGAYDILDESVLNDFNQHTTANALNTGLNYKSERLTLNVSNRLSFETVDRLYNNLNKKLDRNQQSVAPSLSINYKISKSKNFGIGYYGNTTQPSLNQIEPLNQNQQTTVTYLPNPDLKSGYRNRFNFWYNSYKQIKDQSFYVGANFSQSFNDVTAKVKYYSATGNRDITYVNIEKPNSYVSLYSGYRKPIWKKIGLNANIGASASYNNDYNYLSINNKDAELNNNETYNLSPSLGVQAYKAEKWSIYIDLNPGVQFLKSTLQPDLNSNSFVFRSYYNFNYYLPKNFKIGFDGNQSYEAATKTLQAFNTFYMNGNISKKFFKDKSLEAQVFVNDIFNRNKGISRRQNGYSFTQSTNDVLRRYVMFKLIYNFTTMKGDK